MTASNNSLSLKIIADRCEIQDVLVRYCTAIDSLDYALLDTCFVENAFLDYSAMNGPAGEYPSVRAWLEASLRHLEAMQHSISNTVYCIDGDTATTRSQFRNPNVIRTTEGNQHLFTVGGYYDDEWVRTPNGWKITRRVEVSGYIDGTLPGR